MELLTGLTSVFFDPITLILGFVVSIGSAALLVRVYRVVINLPKEFVPAYELMPAYDEGTPFEATAGGVIQNYFDVDRVLMIKPDILEYISARIVELLEEYASAKVCFVEKDSGPVGMIVMGSLIVSKLRRPISTIRIRKDILRMAVKGAPINGGDKIVVVQDVMRTGLQVVEAARIDERFGAQVIAAVVLIDREEEKDVEFVRKNISVRCVMKLSEIQAYYVRSKKPEKSTGASAG